MANTLLDTNTALLASFVAAVDKATVSQKVYPFPFTLL